MPTTNLKKNLLSYLESSLSEKGFENFETLNQFRKKNPIGFQNIVLSTSPQGKQLWIDLNLGCRYDVVEDLVQQFLETFQCYKKEANTLIISVAKLTENKHFHYKIACPEEAYYCAEQILDFMDRQGFAFLEDISCVYHADQLINTDPTQTCSYIYNQSHRCFKGIIMARLANNPEFMLLVDEYYKFLRRLGATPITLTNYDRLVNFLMYYSFN